MDRRKTTQAQPGNRCDDYSLVPAAPGALVSFGDYSSKSRGPAAITIREAFKVNSESLLRAVALHFENIEG